jgi:beta-glucosidase
MIEDFPADFYWGASTSAYQIEGSIENNNWELWLENHSIVESEKYKRVRPEYMSDENYRDACNPDNYINGKACDSFNKYKEDVKILKDLGLNSYRFSVEWSRIEPEKGKFSQEGIQYYKDLVKELKSNDIEPFLTCWHWPVPLWLEEEGGLLSKNIPEYFESYVEFLVENLGEDVKYWITINEPMSVSSASYLIGEWPPQKKNPILYYKVINNLVKMHKVGYLAIKEYDEDLEVSIAKQNPYFEAYNNNPINKIVAKAARYFYNFMFLDRVKDYLDYIGLNYYFHYRIGVFGIKNKEKPLSDMGQWMDPKGIYYPLKELKDRYELPVYITENGVADREDQYRVWWLDETVEAMREALGYGVDLRGYMHWSLLDNFEWSNGYWPRFGLVTRDREIKGSGYYYRDLVENL